MTPAQGRSGLSPRDREILRDVVRSYIGSGEPVSSRSLAKLDRHSLSSATIRNVMADLEEAGYLTQPHTSAGRVPTRSGYRFYVESLESRPVSTRERRYIEQALRPSEGGEELMSRASHLLSELSHQVGVVLTPAVGDTVLRAIDFVGLTGTKILCIVVSDTGHVDHKLLEVDQLVDRDELIRISNYLNDNFRGLALRDIRDRLLRMMSEAKAQVDRLLANALALARQALYESGEPGVLVEGTASLLQQPELADLERVRRVLDTFGDKARLVRLLNQVISGRGVRVLIGDDSELTSDLDFSLVATSYGIGDRSLGTLGVLGPSRMEYQRLIPLVDYLGETLSRALEATLDEE